MRLPLPPTWSEMQDAPYFGPTAPDGPRKEGQPLGRKCFACGEKFTAEDHGFFMFDGMVNGMPAMLPLHLECFIRSTMGSAAHQERRCGCFDPSFTGPEEGPELTRRQHAVEAYLVWYRRSRPPIIPDFSEN